MTILEHDISAGRSRLNRSASGRADGKSAAAFRTIAEVAGDLQLPAHVLRFWESKFPQIKPLKRRGGRRYYRPEDVELLRHIRTLLYTDGYTIRGVQKLLKETAGKPAPASGGAATGEQVEIDLDLPEPSGAPEGEGDEPCPEDSLADVLDELEAIRALLRAHGF